MQLSGVATTFSYTPASGVWLCITSMGGYELTLMLSAQSDPKVYNWLRLNAETGTSNNNAPLKKIFGNGTGVFGSGSHMNDYGITLSGIEI
jgi:hypothetical protein